MSCNIRISLHELLSKLNYQYTPPSFNTTYRKISSLIINNIPNLLYRYRRFDHDKLNISALINDQIWFSTPEKMNDVFDSVLRIDKKKMLDVYAKFILQRENLESNPYNSLPVKIKVGDVIINETLESIHDRYERESGFKKYIDNFNSFFYDKILKDTLDNIITDNYLTNLQSNRRIACFSETITSNRMWGIYSDYHTGFALGYVFDRHELLCKNEHDICYNSWLNYPLFPVIYGVDYPGEFYLIYLMVNNFMEAFKYGTSLKDIIPIEWSFYISSYLYKTIDWEYELEWRMLSKIEKNEQLSDVKPFDYIYYKPSKIFCGNKILRENRDKLINIAKEKGIEIYDMKINVNDNSLYPEIIML